MRVVATTTLLLLFLGGCFTPNPEGYYEGSLAGTKTAPGQAPSAMDYVEEGLGWMEVAGGALGLGSVGGASYVLRRMLRNAKEKKLAQQGAARAAEINRTAEVTRDKLKESMRAEFLDFLEEAKKTVTPPTQET